MITMVKDPHIKVYIEFMPFRELFGVVEPTEPGTGKIILVFTNLRLAFCRIGNAYQSWRKSI